MNDEAKRQEAEGIKEGCEWCDPSKLNIVYVICEDEQGKHYLVPDKAAYCPFCGNKLLGT